MQISMINIFVISADLIRIAEIIFAVMENERTVTGMAKTITGVDYEGGKVVGVTISGIIDVDNDQPTSAYFQRVRHGRWLLQANNERTNYRWNVTAECSECCDEIKEIWAGFFPNVPDWLARDVAIESSKSVKLSNYCSNCGAKMDVDVEQKEGAD